MKIKFSIPTIDTIKDYEEIEVELEGNPTWQDDSFSYAGTHCTGCQSGTHHIPPYTVLDEDVEWNKTLYTDSVNKVIQQWIVRNETLIEETFCHQLEKDSEPDY